MSSVKVARATAHYRADLLPVYTIHRRSEVFADLLFYDRLRWREPLGSWRLKAPQSQLAPT